MIYHGESGLADISQTVKDAVMDIGPYKSRFDFIAVTGMSGVLVASPVAVQLGIPLVVIRKQGDNAHSSKAMINANAAYGKFLFLDDFISLGATFRRVKRMLEESETREAQYAGSYLYEDRVLSWDGDGVVTYRDMVDNSKWDVRFRPELARLRAAA